MHNAAKIILGIGAVGLISSLVLIIQSPNEFTEIDEDIYWGEWIVYQGGYDAS